MTKEKYVFKNTIGMFDLLKGSIMIAVMVSHTYGLLDFLDYSNWLLVAICSILVIFAEAAIPAMFIIGGYGFRNTSFVKCVRKQFKILVKPYLITASVAVGAHLIFYYLRYGGIKHSIKETLRVLAGMLLGLSDDVTYGTFWIRGCGPIWYLLAFAIGSIVFNLLLKYFSEMKLLLASAFVALIGWLLSLIGVIPWGISQGLVATLYICLGYLAKKKKLFKDAPPFREKVLVAIALLVAAGVTFTVGNVFNMALNLYFYGPVSILVFGILGMFFIYLFLRLNGARNFCVNSIRRVGRNSLYILCIHTIEWVAIGKYIQYDFANTWDGDLAVRTLLIIMARLVVVFGCTFSFIRMKRFIVKKIIKRT